MEKIRACDASPAQTLAADGAPLQVQSYAARLGLAALGWVFVAIGLVGIIVPGLPTTVFLLAALWAFSRSSERFRLWLWTHPRFGPPVQAWHCHRVISRRAKACALGSMAASFTVVAVWVADSWVLPSFLAAVMSPAAAYVSTRRSRVPERPTGLRPTA